MKKIILSIAFCLVGIANSFAAKAYSSPVTVIQSDGTELTVYLHGDENFNWITDETGALLTQVGNSYYIAETTSAGKLKATKYLAHNKALRSAAEQQAAAKQNTALFLEVASKTLSSAHTPTIKSIGSGTSGVKYFPHTSSPKALVILAEFTDTVFQSGEKAKGVFNHFLNAKANEALPDGYEAYTGSAAHENLRNVGSVSQYFYDMSQGAFTPQFDVVGPYQLNHTSKYYGAGNDNATALVQDACKAASADGIDFSQYDSDGDGDVDLVYIIYAGYPESMSGNNDDIWPKSGYSTGGYGTFNNKRVRRYGIHAELSYGWALNKANGYLLSGIGLFCHEFSHTLGLPDLYPTVTASQVDNQNPEMWDVMDGGEYTYNGGYSPTPYSPWELDALGWASPVELEDKAQQVTLGKYSTDRTAYKIKGENNEYLLVQNIQADGWWNKLCTIYNHGLLIWRIDYKNNEVNMSDNPNNTLGKPGVMIVPADGYVISDYNHGSGNNKDGYAWTGNEYKESLKGDPYPGTSNVTQLLSVNLNNSTLEKPIYNIKENEDGTVTFDYLKDFTTGIDNAIAEKASEKDANIYTLDGRYLGTDASQLNKGIYIIGKKKVIIK